MSATDLSTKSYDLQVPLNICLNQNREKCNRRWLEIHQIIVATPRSISKKYNLICQTKKKKKKKGFCNLWEQSKTYMLNIKSVILKIPTQLPSNSLPVYITDTPCLFTLNFLNLCSYFFVHG